MHALVSSATVVAIAHRLSIFPIPLLFLTHTARATLVRLLSHSWRAYFLYFTSFYCIILLTALFTSSCYWQPVPTGALFQAAFPNVSTSSPLLYLPNSSVSDESSVQASQLLPVPRLTTLPDRCWCDLSAGHLFDPYNMTLWQLTSLSRTLGATKSQRVLVAQEELSSNPNLDHPSNSSGSRRMSKVWVLRMIGKDESRSGGEEGEEEGSTLASSSMDTHGIWSSWSSFLSWPFQSISSLPGPFNGGQPMADLQQGSPVATPFAIIEKNRLPLLRRKYDLRPHGIDLVVDIGWGRSYT